MNRVLKCLIIADPWIDLILSGVKTWEMRSKRVHIRGRIGLIKKGTGEIWGEAELVDCKQPLVNHAQMSASFKYHRVEDKKLLEKWCYPWVLKNVKKYDKPIPYKHKQGAVTWIDVEL